MKKKSLLFVTLLNLGFFGGCKMGNDSVDISGDILNPKPENQKSASILESGTTQIRDIDGMTMVNVPKGQFEMGSNDQYLCLA